MDGLFRIDLRYTDEDGESQEVMFFVHDLSVNFFQTGPEGDYEETLSVQSDFIWDEADENTIGTCLDVTPNSWDVDQRNDGSFTINTFFCRGGRRLMGTSKGD